MRNLTKALLVAIAAAIPIAAGAAGYPLRVEAVPDEDGVWHVVAHNRGSAPVYVQLDLTKTSNVRNGGASKVGAKVLEPGARETMVMAVPVEPTAQVEFNWEMKWVFGRGSSRGNHDGLYRPPFPGDLTFETTNTAVDHPKREKHAVDIMMPVGTPIIAARSGWVMDVSGEQGGDRVEDGATPVYVSASDTKRMGSYVRIMHDDGTWAEYMGLKEGSIKVTPGVKVEAGTEIAQSGQREGTEPNITFVVMKPLAGMAQPESLEVKMEMAGRGVVVVEPGGAMGASLSVEPGAAAVHADPLIIAHVQQPKQQASAAASDVNIAAKLQEGAPILAAFVALLLAVAGGLAVKRAKEAKGELSWGSWLRAQLLRKKKSESQHEAREAEEIAFAEAKQSGDLRPKNGFIVAEWEEGLYSSLGLALLPGYQVLPKVSLNRLFARPSEWMKHPQAHAQMRGEAVDFLVVRMQDGKIIAAVDIARETLKMPWSEAVASMKQEMLRRAKIKHLVVRGTEGPGELKSMLDEVMGGVRATGKGAGERQAPSTSPAAA